MSNLDSRLKSIDITLPTKVRLVKAMVFPRIMYGCESWTIKKAGGWRTDAFELRCWTRLSRVPWTARRFNQSILKEISSGFHGQTDVEADTPILWPPDVKSWLTRKDPDAGKDWGQEEKGTTEDEMAGWHHWLKGHGFGWTPGVGDGQGGLACCNSWGRKESDTTERLNWTESAKGCQVLLGGAWSSWGRDAVIWRVGRSHKFIPKIEIQINYLTWIWVRSSSESEKVNLFQSCSLLIATAIKFSLLWWLIFNEVSFDDPVYPFIFTVMDTNIKVNQNQGLESTRQKISKGVWWWSSTRI